MFTPQSYKVLLAVKGASDGMGGTNEPTVRELEPLIGYLDLLNGDVQPLSKQNAVAENSTHVFVYSKRFGGLKDPTAVRKALLGHVNNLYFQHPEYDDLYQVTYIDDVVNINHHLEIFLKYVESVV